MINKSTLALGVFFALASCGSPKESNKETTGTPAMEMKADTAMATAYACPMHPDQQSDKPGNCAKCGMKLEPSNHSDDSSHHH